MDYIYRLHYGRIFGVPLRGDAVLYWLDLVCLEKLSFYALDGIMVEIGLLLAGWDGRTRWDGGGVEGPSLAGTGSGVPPLYLEVRRVPGSSGCHQFHWCCRGRGVFVSVH